MQFKVITGVISALFALAALLQLAMGGYLSGLFFLIATVFFLPPIQFEIKERMENSFYLAIAIMTAFSLTLIGLVLAEFPGQKEGGTMIVKTDQTETFLEDGNQLNGTQSSTIERNVDSNTEPPAQTTNPEVITQSVNPAASTVPSQQPRTQATPIKTPVVVSTPTAAPLKTQVPVSTPVPLKTLQPTAQPTDSEDSSGDEAAQEAAEIYQQLDNFLQIGQSMKADRQSSNPAAQAACAESMRNTLSDAQAAKRQSDALALNASGNIRAKYKFLQKAATEMVSCVTCDKNQAEKSCQKSEIALKDYMRL